MTLSELAWVPCGDEPLRRPREVLAERSPGRAEAPVARISSHLMRVLKGEGIEFGGAVAEPTVPPEPVEPGSEYEEDEDEEVVRISGRSDQEQEALKKFAEAINRGDNLERAAASMVRSLRCDEGAPPPSHTRDTVLGREKQLARVLKTLRGQISGEIRPGEDNETISVVEAGERRVDEPYREAARKYEEEAGRRPDLGKPHQIGWDMRSIDPETNEVRLIEVKGRGSPWEGDEVVELSSPQVRTAFETDDEETGESWWLYVVEATEDGYGVLPIRNPVREAAKWILSGEAWRMMAEGSDEP